MWRSNSSNSMSKDTEAVHIAVAAAHPPGHPSPTALHWDLPQPQRHHWRHAHCATADILSIHMRYIYIYNLCNVSIYLTIHTYLRLRNSKMCARGNQYFSQLVGDRRSPRFFAWKLKYDIWYLMMMHFMWFSDLFND